MNNPELYHNNNSMQRNDTSLCLQEFASVINWKHGSDRIIDIGCGDGSVTADMLKKFIPSNYKIIVGCDVSPEMVKFATLNHSSADTKFMVLDIEGNLPDSMRNSFDHAFSFYVLHWVNQQEHAFTNIYNLLAEDGDCLLMFLGHMPIYDVYMKLARMDRWRYWLRDVNRFISPYHKSLEPEKEVKRTLEKIGFKNVMVKTKHMTYVYHSLAAVTKAVTAINPFNLPNEIREPFMDDYMTILRDMNLVERENEDDDQSINVRFNYDLLIVNAKK